jgi:hypothetical protein
LIKLLRRLMILGLLLVLLHHELHIHLHALIHEHLLATRLHIIGHRVLRKHHLPLELLHNIGLSHGLRSMMHHLMWIFRTIIPSFLFLRWWCLSQFGIIMGISALVPVSAITMLHIVPTLLSFIFGINLWSLPGL